MMRVVVLDDYQNVARQYADWSQLNADVEFINRPVVDDNDLVTLLNGAEVVVAMRERTTFTASRFGLLPDLRLLVTTGMKNAAIDVEAARARNIEVCGTEGTTSATPELAWGLILSVLRHIPFEDQAMRNGGWQTTIGGDLAGHRLGIVGLGRLGSNVAKVGVAFGMEVVAWSQNLDKDRAAEHGIRAVSKQELFKTSDVVSIHYKLSERSRGIVGAEEIALMKPSAVLINTSRGPLVDTDALITALNNADIAGAGLDVYDNEPLLADHPLRSTPRTVLTPHIGYVTDETYRIFYPQAVEDIVAWREGSPVRQLT